MKALLQSPPEGAAALTNHSVVGLCKFIVRSCIFSPPLCHHCTFFCVCYIIYKCINFNFQSFDQGKSKYNQSGRTFSYPQQDVPETRKRASWDESKRETLDTFFSDSEKGKNNDNDDVGLQFSRSRPRTPIEKFTPAKLDSFEKNLKTNMGELSAFVTKLSTKSISVQCDHDNVIIEQLLEFIKSLTDDFESYEDYVDSIEIAYETLETEYYKAVESATVLADTDEILQQQLYDQQEQWEAQVKTLSLRGAISFEDASEVLGVGFNEDEATEAKVQQLDKNIKEITEKEQV